MIKKVSALLIAVILCFALCSCANKTEGQESGEIHCSFTDALGREVVLKDAPVRTACLYGSFSDVWVKAQGTLCAATEDTWLEFDIPQGDSVNLGGNHSPSLETLLETAPDFVIANAGFPEHVEMKEILESAGIPVAYFDIDDFEDYLEMLKIFVTITGASESYEEYATKLVEEITSIKSEYAGYCETNGKAKILIIRASSSSVKAKGSHGTTLGDMCRDMGCINIADGNDSILDDLSIEHIIEEDPDFILVITMGSDGDAAIRQVNDLIAENPAWASLRAVKEGKLIIMDKALFHLKPNARWAEAYRVLYETLTK